MSVGILIILLLIAFLGIFFVIAGFNGAVWVPIASKDLAVICEQLNLRKGTKVYEFGCGDARFLRHVSRKGSVAVGYEINPVMAIIARFLSLGTSVTIKVGDAWNSSFYHADVVFAFIMPEYMERLEQKMTRELAPGTIVVTYVYPLPVMDHYLFEGNAYFYKMP